MGEEGMKFKAQNSKFKGSSKFQGSNSNPNGAVPLGQWATLTFEVQNAGLIEPYYPDGRMEYTLQSEFWPGARRERGAYPQGSVTSEQRSPRTKGALPEGLRQVFLLAALLVGHRSLRTSSLLAPCQKENLTQQSLFHPAVRVVSLVFWASLGF